MHKQRISSSSFTLDWVSESRERGGCIAPIVTGLYAVFWKVTHREVRGSNARKYNRTLLLTDRANGYTDTYVYCWWLLLVYGSDLLKTRAKHYSLRTEMKLWLCISMQCNNNKNRYPGTSSVLIQWLFMWCGSKICVWEREKGWKLEKNLWKRETKTNWKKKLYAKQFALEYMHTKQKSTHNNIQVVYKWIRVSVCSIDIELHRYFFRTTFSTI